MTKISLLYTRGCDTNGEVEQYIKDFHPELFNWILGAKFQTRKGEINTHKYVLVITFEENFNMFWKWLS